MDGNGYWVRMHIKASTVSNGTELWLRLVLVSMMALIFLMVDFGLVFSARVLISVSISLLISASLTPVWNCQGTFDFLKVKS